jgi:transcriptional regulator with XRE-family HTH domain
MIDPDGIGGLIMRLRRKAGFGLRELSRMAGMSPAALSAIEKGKSSPTLATLHKMLRALGTDFAHFFAVPSPPVESPVFPAQKMQEIEDAFRKYRFLLPRRENLRFEMLMETIAPTEKEPEWESHDCDLGGVVLSGGPVRLEIDGRGEWVMKKGDAFYVKAGAKHRAFNLGESDLKILTVFDPPRY